MTILLQPDVMCTLTDEIYDALMGEYGRFIKERVITDKNPAGCFILHDKREYAAGQSAEIADEITDPSAPIKVPQTPKRKRKKQ
ncbi:MAG: hypothetical protein IKD78_06350 [Bacteroidales bacterium]|nr:hypothetical protein [Bacteroidales bacterium]